MLRHTPFHAVFYSIGILTLARYDFFGEHPSQLAIFGKRGVVEHRQQAISIRRSVRFAQSAESACAQNDVAIRGFKLLSYVAAR